MSISELLTKWLPTGGEAPSRPETAAAADQVDFATVLRILRRQWPVVLLTLAVFCGAAVAYAVLTPKTWRSSARVLLEPRDKQIVGTDVGRQMQGIELGWVETRQELVKSYDTLAAVVKKEKLVDDPEVLSPAARDAAGPDAVAAAVRNLADMVLVERPKENALIDVTVTTRSPEKAARLANAVAQAFVDGLAGAKVEQVEQANALLARQVDEMRSKMLAAEARVEDYKRDHGIAMTRGNLVEEETLRQSNENLIAARTRTQEARERAERLNQALKSGDPAISSQNDTVGSAVISRLKIEAAMALRRKTELEQTLGPRHPRVASAAAEVERARAQVTDEVKSLAATADLDYQVARANEENARKAVERAQAHLADASQATVGLQELENEANARRELYKHFVSRMEETTLQRNTQISDASIVSPAQIPLRPFAPRGSLALSLALVAGLGTGLALALHRGRRQFVAARRDPPPPAEGSTAPSPTSAPVAAALDATPSAESPVAPAAEATGVPAEAAPAVEPAPSPSSHSSEAPLVVPDPSASAVAAFDLAPAVDAVPAETRSEVAPPVPDHVVAEPTAVAPAEMPPASAPAAEGTTAPVAAFRRTTLALSIDVIARLGTREGPGCGVPAPVETETGAPDDAGLDRFRRLAGDLDAVVEAGRVRVVFSNTVPTLLSAAVAHGLARVAGPAALVDLAHEAAAFDPLFEAASPVALGEPAGTEDAWERVDADGLRLLRPLDPIVAGDTRPLGDLAEVLAGLRAEGRAIVLHLGRTPTAALLFDCAEIADHVVAVVDETDLSGRRVSGEIDVMKGLMPHFDGLVVLTHAPEDVRLPPPAVRPGVAV